MSHSSSGDDPTDLDGTYPVPGILPVTSKKPRKDTKTNASNAASAAGARAFTAQAVAFYFRAPVKAFFRTRVDYLAYARSLQQQNLARANDSTSRRLAWLRSTTPGVIASAVRYYGWRVIPEQILPPLVANVTVGAVLYASYLQTLGHLHEESSTSARRVYPPPSPLETFTAGFLAGSIQSIVAAPLDAIQVRYERYDNAKNGGHPQTMWAFGKKKLHEIGARGIFAGYSLSLMKDSAGSAVFFSTFEYVKAQGYYNFIRWYYGSLNNEAVDDLARKRPHHTHHKHAQYSDTLSSATGLAISPAEKAPPNRTITPHYAIEPGFLFLAGLSASVVQSAVIYPFHHLQVEHWEHLEALDQQATELRHHARSPGEKRWAMLRNYYKAYQVTWQDCKKVAVRESGGRVGRWLYRGFWWNTIRQLPSTSAGLIIFELVRRKYGLASDEELFLPGIELRRWTQDASGGNSKCFIAVVDGDMSPRDISDQDYAHRLLSSVVQGNAESILVNRMEQDDAVIYLKQPLFFFWLSDFVSQVILHALPKAQVLDKEHLFPVLQTQYNRAVRSFLRT